MMRRRVCWFGIHRMSFARGAWRQHSDVVDVREAAHDGKLVVRLDPPAGGRTAVIVSQLGVQVQLRLR